VRWSSFFGVSPRAVRDVTQLHGWNQSMREASWIGPNA
jgi:hypothetical protein